MDTPNRQNIYIYEHPESKIRFLETTLDGQDWRATIIYPPNAGQSSAQMHATEKLLNRRGFAVHRGQDAQGNTTLAIHHFGKGSAPLAVFQELGLLRGTGRAIANPNIVASKAIDLTKKSMDWVAGSLHDPARANGIVNTTAEVFLSSAGMGAQYGKWHDLKNQLHSLAGFSWLAQSMTFLFFAKNNEEQAFGKLKTKLRSTAQAGGDITQIRYDAAKDDDSHSIAYRIGSFVRRYPVQIGAILNNLGMVAYIAHAFHERKFRLGQIIANPHTQEEITRVAEAVKYVGNNAKGFVPWAKTGFGKDIIGASLSLIGWSVLMLPATKPQTDLQAMQSDEGLLRHSWRKFRENTPFAAGLFTLAASSFRLMGAKDKHNKQQQIGETIYIGGDVALMFTNSHEYGGDAKLNPEKLTKKIMEHVRDMPILFGAKAQEDFVTNSVQYWLDKQCSDANIHPRNTPLPRQQMEETAVELKQALSRKLHHQQTERLEHLHEAAADIITRFPHAVQQQVAQKLATTLCAMPWLRASEQEVTAGIMRAYAKQPAKPATATPPLVGAVAEDVAILLAIVPHIDKATASVAIYDALAPHLHAQPSTSVHRAIAAARVLPPPHSALGTT